MSAPGLAGLCVLAVASCQMEPPPTPTPPAAPSGLEMENATYCTVAVRWSDNSTDEDAYHVRRSTDSAFTDYVEAELEADTTRYEDNGLTPLTTYFYRVLASNAFGSAQAPETVQVTTPAAPPGRITSRVADHTVVSTVPTGSLPVSAIQGAKTSLHIGYGHTSHGSQIADGMTGLVGFANASGCAGVYAGTQDLFAWNRGGSAGALDLREGDGYGNGDLDHDCGYYPLWVDETRAYLDATENSEINVIIWSWCGQASGYTEQVMIDQYLAPMAQLEADYPGVTFVYMTGHLDGSGVEGNLHARNEQIRAHCFAREKWLFDFSDIESFDPDGVDYRDRRPTDGCVYQSDEGERNWAEDWQAAHTQDVDWYDCGAAHSLPVNANMKAYAAWWLWCRLAGWEG